MRDGQRWLFTGLLICAGLCFTARWSLASDDAPPEKATPPAGEQVSPKTPHGRTTEAETKKPLAKKSAAKKQKRAGKGGLLQRKSEQKNAEQGEGQTKYVTMPVVTPDVRAPRTNMKPSATVLGVPPRKVSAGLAAGLKTAPGAGFELPDMSIPLRADHFDELVRPFGKDEVVLTGHVRLHLDTIDLAADKFSYSKSGGEMHAEGNVIILQGTSELDADDVYYKMPDPSQVAKPRILSPRLDADDLEKLRLSQGLFKAHNVAIFEPTEELAAESFTYDFGTSTGDLEDAKGRIDAYYFGAAKLHILGPASMDGQDVWVTTCDENPPHYKIRLKKALIRDKKAVFAQSAHLEVLNKTTPFYWPQWGYDPDQAGTPANFDFKTGYHSKVGNFINMSEQFQIEPNATLGARLYPTTKAGVGFGLESQYDFTKTPASPLFLSKGTVQSLATTDGRGYLELKHQQEIFDDTQMLVQVEKWSDKDFYRDFFYTQYKNHDAPRSFVNVTDTQPGYIASGTVRVNTNDFVRETERLPEGSFHLLERPIAKNLYLSFDTIDGYNIQKPSDVQAFRMANIGRLTYDLKLGEGLNLLPFDEVEGTFYSQDLDGDHPDFLLTNTLGATFQTRFHKEYDGAFGFSGFKHVVVPSVTYFYRTDPTMNVNNVPYFDFYDYVPGRSRIETKLDNVVFGKDEQLDEVWQVARLTLYEGYDLWNEERCGDDYEAGLDLRPRPWWGVVLTGDRHQVEGGDNGNTSNSLNSAAPNTGNGDTSKNNTKSLLQQDLNNFNEWAFGKSTYSDVFKYYLPYGNYNRLLTYLYYDDKIIEGRFSGRVGFAYTETESKVYNREILYGFGYKIGEKWGLAFEHRYDLDKNELVQQIYEVRRNLHCWEAALQFRDRQQGWDIGISFNLAGFPGTRVKF